MAWHSSEPQVLTALCDNRAYSNNVGQSMTYATSSPAATTGGQGNTPVSCPSPSHPTKKRDSACRTPYRQIFSNPRNPYRITTPPMATLTDSERGLLQPVCQNCTTSTTPLWRRDEIGSVLCNACGLFLKLHGRPRPISLKTDVIKSRNRVKSSGQGPKKKVRITETGSVCEALVDLWS